MVVVEDNILDISSPSEHACNFFTKTCDLYVGDTIRWGCYVKGVTGKRRVWLIFWDSTKTSSNTAYLGEFDGEWCTGYYKVESGKFKGTSGYLQLQGETARGKFFAVNYKPVVVTCDQLFYILDDKTGLGVNGATVTVKTGDGTVVGSCVTDSGGVCAVTELTIGNMYSATVTKSGYDTFGPQGFSACITPYWDISITPTLEYCSQNVYVETSDGAVVNAKIEWGDGASEYGDTPKTFTHHYEEGKSVTVTVSATGYSPASKTFTTCISQFTLTLQKAVELCHQSFRVIDKDTLERIAGATVTISTSSCTTNAYGECTIYNLGIDSGYTAVIEATGYETLSDSFIACTEMRLEKLTPEPLVGTWSKQDFINEITKRGKIPVESLPPYSTGAIGWVAMANGTHIGYYGKKCNDKTFFIYINIIENPPTTKECIRWQYDVDYYDFGVEGSVPVACAKKALDELYVPVVKKDTVICGFTIEDADGKEVTTLTVGVQYTIPAYLCEQHLVSCAVWPTKGCFMDVYGVENGILKLAKADGTLIDSVQSGSTSSVGWGGFHWTPKDTDIGSYSVKLKFDGITGVNACESSTTAITVGAPCTFIVNCPDYDIGKDLKCVEMWNVFDIFWVPAVDILGNPIIVAQKAIPASRIVEFSSADGLIPEKYYAFYAFPKMIIDVSSKDVYECSGTKEITVSRVGIHEQKICGFFGIDPASTECTVFIAEFADPVFVANTISVITKHEDVAGNPRDPTTLDYVLLPIVCLGMLAPAIPVGKILKSGGLLSKYGKKSATMGKFLDDEATLLMKRAISEGDADRLNKFLGHLDEASKHADGSAEMGHHLQLARNTLDDIIANPAVESDEALRRLVDWIEEASKRMDESASVTSKTDVFKKSGIRQALRDVLKKPFEKFSKTRAAAKAHNAPIELEGQLYDLADITIRQGATGEQIIKRYVLRPTGLWGWLKRHKIGAGIALGWIFVMGPWFTLDNSQFIVYILRNADIIPETWGNQWDTNAGRRDDAYFTLMNAPCTAQYQQQYVDALTEMRTLLDGADPIPTDKIDKAKYILSVIYGFEIGDPNDALKSQLEIDYAAWQEWYFQVTQACPDVIQPPGGFQLVELEETMYNVKIENVVDGDTFDVSSDDIMWPHGIPLRIRTLGINTPEGASLYYLIRRLAIVGGTEERLNADKVLYDEIDLWTTIQLWHALVTLKIDLENTYGEHNRPVAVVEKDGVDIGEEDLKKGYAPVFFYSPNARMSDIIRDGKTREQIYLEAEDVARTANIGVWPFFLECSCMFDKSTYVVGDNAILYYTNAPVGSEFKLINPDGVTVYSSVVSGSGDVTKKLDKVGTWRLTLFKDECSAEDVATVTVCPLPVASFTKSATTIKVGETINFNDTSTAVAAYPITGRLWEFPDGTTSTLKNPSKTFSTSCATCPVKLTVTNDCGSNSATQNITITEAPPGKGAITITTSDINGVTVTGATVFVDGIDKGNAPVTITNLLVSENPHTVEIVQGDYGGCVTPVGYNKCTPVIETAICCFKVNVVKDITIPISVTLVNLHSVLFVSDPTDAELIISLRGEEKWEVVPAGPVSLIIGSEYDVTWIRSGYEALEGSIKLAETRVECLNPVGVCDSKTPPGIYIFTAEGYPWKVGGYLKPTGKILTIESIPAGATIYIDEPVMALGAEEQRVEFQDDSLSAIMLNLATKSACNLGSNECNQKEELPKLLYPISPYEILLSMGTHTIRWAKDGYEDLIGEIDVTDTGVACLSVTGGVCGSTIPPGIITSDFTAIGYLQLSIVDTICAWIDESGVDNLTLDHALYIFYLSQGATGAADAKYAALSPQPSELLEALATLDNALGTFYYSQGAKGAGNTKTGCSYPA